MQKIDALNYIARRVLGGVNYAALDTGGHSAASDIERYIDEQSSFIQSRGWSFNTYPDITLTPDGSGFINFDSDVLKEYVDPCDVNAHNNYQRQGTQLYDMENQTLVFTSPVNMTLVKLIAFDNVPEPFRQWIAASSACRYNESRGFRDRQQSMDRDELKAKVEAERYESRTRHGSTIQTPSAAAFRGSRYRYGSSFNGGRIW